MPWIPLVPDVCPICGTRRLSVVHTDDNGLPGPERICLTCFAKFKAEVWFDMSQLTKTD